MRAYREIENESKGSTAVLIVAYLFAIIGICLFFYALFSFAGLLLSLI